MRRAGGARSSRRRTSTAIQAALDLPGDASLPPYPQGHTAWHDVAQWPGVFAVGFMGWQKSSAARAAHRELRSLLRLFLASNACDRRARPPCLYDTISRHAPKRPRANSPRNNWPETNVGASIARDASVTGQTVPTGKAPGADDLQPVKLGQIPGKRCKWRRQPHDALRSLVQHWLPG